MPEITQLTIEQLKTLLNIATHPVTPISNETLNVFIRAELLDGDYELTPKAHNYIRQILYLPQ